MGSKKISRSQDQSGRPHSHSQPSFNHPDIILGQPERVHYQPKNFKDICIYKDENITLN